MKILFKYASRSRPTNFFRGLDSIVKNCVSKDNEFIFSFDKDDTTMNNEGVITRLNNYEEVDRFSVIFGKSSNKIDAINRDVPQEGWDILVCMSDDMVFLQPSFDNTIRYAFTTFFPDLDGVIHFNDGSQRGNCMTMSIIGNKYYQRDGWIYCPEYESLECDVEAMEVARIRGKYKYIGDFPIIFKHLHPSFGLAPMDKQYEKTEGIDVRSKDRTTFDRRKANNFYI